MSACSRQLTLKKGAPGDQVRDLLCVQLASYWEGGPDVDDAPAKSYYDLMIMRVNAWTCVDT